MEYKLDCVIWEITLRCNLRCSHCGSAAGDKRPNELNTLECFGLGDELAELGCQNVSLMGGELFLREDWLAIAQYIKNLGMDLSIVSNGVLLENFIDNLKMLQPKVIGISLDGEKGTHEKIRGLGTYDKVIDSIRLLKRNKIQVTVITSVSKLNYQELPRLKNEIKKLGANWQLQLAVPSGNFAKELILSPEQFYGLGLFIAKIRQENKLFDFPISGTHSNGYFSQIIPGTRFNGCTAGISSLGITSNGDIAGCITTGVNRLVEGNIRDRKLVDIWNDPDSFSYTRKFALDQLGKNCQGCEHGGKCQGGCNGVSYACSQEFHNDPYCFYNIERNIINL